MIHLSHIPYLQKHIDYLSNIIDSKTLFLVWWSVRDVLLDITTDPIDIDLTCAWHPNTLREEMFFDEELMSRFRTEKFGTMTILPKNGHMKWIAYELTPFRTEGIYTDVRHPDDIFWSNHLSQDSKRRDFTINCLYYTYTSWSSEQQQKIHEHESKELTKEQQYIQLTSKQKDRFFKDANVCILHNSKSIETIFPEWILDTKALENHLWIIEQYHTKKYEKNIHNLNTNLHILIDLHEWMKDMLHHKIKTVGNPEDRFTEDALRILRWVRFPNILNQKIPNRWKQNSSFDIEKKTRDAMKKHASLVLWLAKERIHEELVKVFSWKNPFGYICLLDELNILKILFPELHACKNNIQPIRYHPFDTYNHTLLALHVLQNTDVNYLAKLAMLYHDVGKPEQYAYISEQKKIHGDEPIDMSWYQHHTETWAIIWAKAFANLWCSKKECEEISRYIKRHHRPWEILDSSKKNRMKKIRLLLSDGWLEMSLNLVEIAIADRKWQFNPLQSPAIEELYDMRETLQLLHNQEWRFTTKELDITGKEIMKHYNLKPGPRVWEIISACFDRVAWDVITRNNKKTILRHLKTLISDK